VWRMSAMNGAIVLLFGLLLATRALGQSALSVCSIATVGRWFPNRAGFAMGVYSVLLSILFAAAFGAIGYSVRTDGWRVAWFRIAVGLIVVVAPLTMLILREPKGRRQQVADEAEAGPKNQATLTDALTSKAFW